MSAEAAYIGVDLGSTFFKAVAVDGSGRELGVGRVATPWRRGGGIVYADAQEVAESSYRVISQALATAGPRRVEALGATSMAESGVLLDGRGQPVAPILAWFDMAGKHEAAELERVAGARSFARQTGVRLDASRSVVKYKWLRRHIQGTHRGVRWLSLAEWLVYCLGARPTTEASLGARTGFLDIGTASPYLEAWEWAQAPAGLLSPAEPAGTNLGQASHHGAVNGATLVVAGHDHLAAAHGVGAETNGAVLISCGTSITILRQMETLDERRLECALQNELSVGPDLRKQGFVLQDGFLGGRRLERVVARLGLTYDSAEYERCDRVAASHLARCGSPARQEHNAPESTTPTPAEDRLADAWARAILRTWRQVERTVARGQKVAPETDLNHVVCGGWTRSEAFRAAAAAGKLGSVSIRAINEPGARGAARLARQARLQIGDS